MPVRIRMKKMGRTHRPFFRICAMDGRSPRDGRVIEELGTYDPMGKEKDARVTMNSERVDYWLGVGAQPSDKVKVLIKKYGTNGTHLAAQQEAQERLATNKPTAPPPVEIILAAPEAEAPAEEPAAEGDAPAEEATAEAPAEEAAAEEAPAEEKSE